MLKVATMQLKSHRLLTIIQSVHGGVDKSDQLNSYNNMTRKSLKWWKKVFFHLFVTALSNAYIIYHLTVPRDEQKKACDFRLEVAEGLLQARSHEGGGLSPPGKN